MNILGIPIFADDSLPENTLIIQSRLDLIPLPKTLVVKQEQVAGAFTLTVSMTFKIVPPVTKTDESPLQVRFFVFN